MCRLFGLHGGAAAVPATFWLLDAADSLEAQSRRNPDGAGIGVFEAEGTSTADLSVRTSSPLRPAPRHVLQLAHLDAHTAASQHPESAGNHGRGTGPTDRRAG